ncbi:MAG: Arm DNA-binding domain-containing protein [Rhodospirillaceae bacterium]
MPKLTKRIVDAAEIRASEYFIWDDDIPGLGLRVLPSGRKGYVVQYRAGRRSRRMSLGPSTVVTCEQARTRAIGIIAAARNGERVDLLLREACVFSCPLAQAENHEGIAVMSSQLDCYVWILGGH